MEGFEFDGQDVRARPGLDLLVRPQEVMGWGDFRAYANRQAMDALAKWSIRESLVLAFVVQQPDGESFVA